jgi:hypothetical protein
MVATMESRSAASAARSGGGRRADDPVQPSVIGHANIYRLVDAIADGSLPSDEIKSRLQIETEKRRALESELASLGSVAKVARLDAAAIARDLRAKVSDVSALLAEKTPQARAMLRKILVGPIMVHPVRRGKTRGFRFEGRASFAKLVSGEGLDTWRGVPDGQYRRDGQALLSGASGGGDQGDSVTVGTVDRRTFIVTAVDLLAAPLAGEAQQAAGKVYRSRIARPSAWRRISPRAFPA